MLTARRSDRWPVLVAIVALGCAAEPALAPRDCTPGTTSSCTCPGGAIGAQTCTAEGVVGTCGCTAPDASADAATGDAAPQEDRAPGGDAVAVADAGGLDAADVVALEDRPAVSPDLVTAADVVDAPAVTDVVDVVIAADVRVDCTGGNKHTCRTHSDCQTQCSPHPSGDRIWCCTLGGQCTTSIRAVCPL